MKEDFSLYQLRVDPTGETIRLIGPGELAQYGKKLGEVFEMNGQAVDCKEDWIESLFE